VLFRLTSSFCWCNVGLLHWLDCWIKRSVRRSKNFNWNCHPKWRLQSACEHLTPNLKTHLFQFSFPILTVKWLQCHRHFFHFKLYCIRSYCIVLYTRCRCSSVSTPRLQQEAISQRHRRRRYGISPRHVSHASMVHVVQRSRRIVYGSVSFSAFLVITVETVKTVTSYREWWILDHNSQVSWLADCILS